ncbi:hypothetical protein B0H67DRAFT_645063 [Lasiosphaeris hirsuta]|uniref:F-box domain-containing protein n=1 Tax=Lasiosphaeris hirsuta TaxID=260670 RepID=A0AA40AGB0_9PEZI|nr:hypothetical protein B0H67DRAFT_645063 [Lasiosphaeris hirsuta]
MLPTTSPVAVLAILGAAMTLFEVEIDTEAKLLLRIVECLDQEDILPLRLVCKYLDSIGTHYALKFRSLKIRKSRKALAVLRSIASNPRAAAAVKSLDYIPDYYSLRDTAGTGFLEEYTIALAQSDIWTLYKTLPDFPNLIELRILADQSTEHREYRW